ncbi:MAG: Fic family protein [Gemmatimonadaceae bacterium]
MSAYALDLKESGWYSEYPFIQFDYDPRNVDRVTWILLGECSSKIQHISGVPLQPDTADSLNQIYLAKGVHATTAIEGNTLSEDQVEQRMAKTLELPRSQEYMGVEVDNIQAAYNYIVGSIQRGSPLHVTPDEFTLMNFMVLKGLDLPADVEPGIYRTHRVGVSDYRAPSPEHIPELVERLCGWLNKTEWNQTIGSPFVVSILKAILSHLYLAWIHPFGDGNGRTARLLEFDVLARAGVPTVCAHLLADYYNRTRPAYYAALSRARKDPTHFVTYAVAGYVEGLRSQLKTIREQQINVAWINYVYEWFDDQPDSKPTRRRREILLALSWEAEPVEVSGLASLTPKLAALYASVDPRALDRDITFLEQNGLLVRDRRGRVSANQERVLAFLPLVNRVPEPIEEQLLLGVADL